MNTKSFRYGVMVWVLVCLGWVHSVHAQSEQIPLCMIGDSITWADQGDRWRSELLKHIPTLAFVGTHSGRLGYSHAGEGGNNTGSVLARIEAIPDSAYYHLLIGTNDNNVKDAALVQERARQTADRIEQIVVKLLQKPSVKQVFVSSLLPCWSDDLKASSANPLRAETNAATNVILRKKIASWQPAGKVVFVDLEPQILALPDWKETIRLHPTAKGYELLGRLLAEALRKEWKLPPRIESPKCPSGWGVQVNNLWKVEQAGQAEQAGQGGGCGQTTQPIIAGWYTFSFRAWNVQPNARIRLTLCAASEKDKQAEVVKEIPVQATSDRQQMEIMSGYEGYGYTRSVWRAQALGCDVKEILLEKRRPSGQASVFGNGEYVDLQSPVSLGEFFVPSER